MFVGKQPVGLAGDLFGQVAPLFFCVGKRGAVGGMVIILLQVHGL